MLQKYSEQRRGGAFLNGYKTEGVVEQMDDSREHIENIVRLYKEVNTAEFPNL
jgi:hypothetical protein